MVHPTDKKTSDTNIETQNNNASIIVERRKCERRNTNSILNQPLTPSEVQNLAYIWIITEDTNLFNQLQNDIKVSFSSSNINQHTPTQIESQDNKRFHNKTVKIHPDVILIDGRSSIEKLISLLNKIRKRMTSTEIILLYDEISSDFINIIIEYHINGAIPTGTNPKLLIKAINAVCTGEIWLPRPLITNAFKVCFKQKEIFCSSSSMNSLITASEERILKLLAFGRSNKQIAQKLAVSPETIKKHLKSLFAKADVHSRCELLSWYLSKGNSD